MHTTVELPPAFSVREENEFLSFRHLLTRLNSTLVVQQVGTGRHVNGGATVLWGLVYSDEEPPTEAEIEAALQRAGYDFTHNMEIQASRI